MKTENEIKKMIKEKYSQIANQSKKENETSCCGATVSGCCETEVFNIMADSYSNLNGYVADADLGLGCGLPTEFAKISLGDVVVDLGSGAGNDAFIARQIVGENGKVFGIDMTPSMVEKAKINSDKLNFKNVEFKLGEIENIPLEDNIADVVVSNCVINLVPNKEKVFTEIKRILKPGGHFSISDIVLQGELSDTIKQLASLYAGCISGAIQKDEYLSIVKNIGFKNITIQKEKVINVPDNILLEYISESELNNFKKSNVGIFSITLFAEK